MGFDKKRLIILDADGTTINAFEAMARTFALNHMNLGDLSRFQKRHNLFKYIGGVKELPTNLRKQLKKFNRDRLIDTLTEIYQSEASLFEGMSETIERLIADSKTVVGIVSRNITREPEKTLSTLYQRHGVSVEQMDFLITLKLSQKKTDTFRALRQQYNINPALCYVCGDESKDYVSAIATGMHPIMASYGFESRQRLTDKFEIPQDIICDTPAELSERLIQVIDYEKD